MRGRKTASNDPDLGAWSYAYDTASELISQTDAKSQTTNFAYDKLGRMTQRVEPDLTSTWTYDTAAYGIGKLAVSNATGAATGLGAQGIQKTFTYDNLEPPRSGRHPHRQRPPVLFLRHLRFQQPALERHLSFRLHGQLRLHQPRLPIQCDVADLFRQSNTGLLAGEHARRRAATDAQTAGNGVVTTQSFDPLTDRLTSILAGAGNAVENFSYTYDVLGNVLSRADANENLSETFTYDNLNRLTLGHRLRQHRAAEDVLLRRRRQPASRSPTSAPTPIRAAGSALPHAVTAVNGTINSTFSYDANGNQTGGNNRRSIPTFPSTSRCRSRRRTTYQYFLYDTEHARFWRAAPEGGTLYFDAFGVHAE